MKKIETLIDLSRRATENLDYTDTTGIQQSEFIQYFTDAIKRIESVINVHHPKAFLRNKKLSVAPAQENVSIPVDVFLGTRILTVEFNSNISGDSGFYLLKKGSLQERFNGVTGDPVFYIREGSNLILKPGSQGAGQVRLVYQKAQPAADIRRGEIQGVTIAGSTLTALSLDPASVSAVFDAEALNDQNYLTIIDRDGAVKMANVPISSVDQNTGVVTIYGGTHTFESDESAQAGYFVCAGPYSSNVCKLPDVVERYLLAYVNTKINYRDSNVDIAEASQELKMIEEDILASFKEPDGDVDYVTILDSQFVGIDDYGAWN